MFMARIGLGKISLISQQKLTQFSRMGIYFKDKDLDKTKYKPIELDQINNYVKNYMKDDPKQLNEEEKKKLLEQYEQFEKEQKLKEQTMQKQNIEKEDEMKTFQYLDPSRVKKFFAQLTEMGVNPDNKDNQEFVKKMQEIEKQKPKQKRGEIIIKTFRRDRLGMLEQQDLVQRLTREEGEYKKKFIDYKAITFPEIDPINMKVRSDGKEYKIANYRYPSQQKDKKGIIYYIHAYGDYCERYAYLAKQFADNGYDFVGIDQRGFGHSEGPKGYIESIDSVIQDQLQFFDLINEKYEGQNVPKFMLGNSLGGLLALNISMKREGWFKGMGLLAPYIKLQNEQMLGKFMPVASVLDKVFPKMKLAGFPEKKNSSIPKHLEHFLNDPLMDYKKIPVHSVVLNAQVMKKLQDDADKIKTPFVLMLGGKDEIVDNRAAKQFFDKTASQDKDIITYDDLTHMIIHDGEYLPLLTKDLIAWFDAHCQ